MSLNALVVSQIQRLLEDGMSERQIAKKVGVSRPAVHRIRIGAPKRSKKRSVHREMIEKRDRIKELFFKHRQNCAVLLDHMQEVMEQKVERRLLEIFCKPFREEARLSKDAAEKRNEKGPGIQMQIDFGEDEILVDGLKTKVHVFVAKMSFSRRIFAKAYPAENQATWMDGIESALRYFGGIPLEIVCDNAKSLVKNPRAPYEDRFTDQFYHVCKYYGMTPVATAVGHPQSKGKVEAGVKYVKGNFFADRSEFQSFEEIDERLVVWMKKTDTRRLSDPLIKGEKIPIKRWAQEEPLLGKLDFRPPIAGIEVLKRIVDRYGLLRVDNCLYKLPNVYARERVQVISSKDKLWIIKPGMATYNIEKAMARYTPTYQEKSIRPCREREFQEALQRNQEDENWRRMQNPEIQRSTTEYDWIMEGEDHGGNEGNGPAPERNGDAPQADIHEGSSSLSA